MRGDCDICKEMKYSGESIRVVHPLFQEEGDGSTPISPLQLSINKMPKQLAKELNNVWHSRLPDIRNWQNCECYGADYKNKFYAVAMWSIPSARMLNGKGWFELRRMAIAPDAPFNTATRMLKIMRILIKREHPELSKLISYQDCDVHHGTIYKASGWTIGNISERINEDSQFHNWKTRPGRSNQSTAPKIRWEYDL